MELMSDDIASSLAACGVGATIISDRSDAFEQVGKALAVVPTTGEKVCTSLQTAHYRASSESEEESLGGACALRPAVGARVRAS